MTTKFIKNVTYATKDFTLILSNEQYDVIESDLLNKDFFQVVEEFITYSLVTYTKTIEDKTTTYVFFLNKDF